MMENIDTEILDSSLVSGEKASGRRRDLLPIWIKIFTWIFLISGFLTPLGLILGIFGIQFNVSLYGLSATSALSLLGLFLTGLFLLKGVAALGLWLEQDWAIPVAQIDAILGIVVCSYVMVVHPFISSEPGVNFTFRLELVLLIPYLMKLGKIKEDWAALAER